MESIPYPLSAGTFWATGLKQLYGDKHIFVGIRGDSCSNGTDDNDTVLLGIRIEVEDGMTVMNDHEKNIGIKIKILDFKIVSEHEISEADSVDNYPVTGENCYLECIDVEIALKKYNELLHPLNQRKLVKDYEEDYKEFYKKYINMFYPALLKFNIRKEKDGPFFSKQHFKLHSENLVTYPPSSFELHLKKLDTNIATFNSRLIHVDLGNRSNAMETFSEFTFESIDRLLKYNGNEKLSESLLQLSFPIHPQTFWENGVWQLTDILLALTRDVILDYDKGNSKNIGPLLTGMTFMLEKSSNPDSASKYELRFKIQDLKMISIDGLVKIEATGGEYKISCKDVQKVNHAFKAIREKKVSWNKLIEEHVISNDDFVAKYISYFYPADLTINTGLKLIIGDKVYRCKDSVTFVGARDSFKLVGAYDVYYKCTSPIYFVEDSTRNDEICITIPPFESKWTYPWFYDESEIKILEGLLDTDGLTYYFVKEKVTKIMLAPLKLEFSLCPGQFLEEGIRANYGSRFTIRGLVKNFELKVKENVVYAGSLTSLITFGIRNGTSWDYPKKKLIRISLEVFEFKLLSANGEIEIDVDHLRTGEDGVLEVINVENVLENFAKHFSQHNWEEMSQECKFNSSFYSNHVGMFFPITFQFQRNLMLHLNEHALLGVNENLYSLHTVNFICDEATEFPSGNLEIRIPKKLEFVQVSNACDVVATADIQIINFNKAEILAPYKQ